MIVSRYFSKSQRRTVSRKLIERCCTIEVRLCLPSSELSFRMVHYSPSRTLVEMYKKVHVLINIRLDEKKLEEAEDLKKRAGEKKNQ